MLKRFGLTEAQAFSDQNKRQVVRANPGRALSVFGHHRLACLASAAVAIAIGSASPAYAACTMAGTVVSCSGAANPLAPSYSTSWNNLTVTVNNGAGVGVLLGVGGTAMSLTGTNITLTNNGRIDPMLLGSGLGVLSSGLVVGNSSINTNSITNNGILAGTTNSSISLTGMAIAVQNGTGGVTNVTNTGTLSTTGIVGATLLGADAGVVTAYGGGQVDFTNSGTITGRIGFASSAAGNRFTNAATINGSVSLGENSANEFIATTDSIVSAAGGTATATSINAGPSTVNFAATGIVDGGTNGNNKLNLKQGVSQTATLDSSRYINFHHLEIEGGSWTLTDASSVTEATIAAGATAIINNVAGLGTGTISVNGGAIETSTPGLALTNNIALSAAGLTVQGASDLTISGTISGNGNITKSGASSLTLSGVNTYVGATNLNGGKLVLSNDQSISSGALTVGGNATLDNSQIVAIANQITINPSATLTIGGSHAISLSGAISGVGSIVKHGSETATLTGANSYTGGTTVSVGTLALGAGGTLAASGGVTIDSGATFDIGASGPGQTIGALNGNTGSTLSLGTVNLQFGAATNDVFAGVISGTGSIAKQGTGKATLSGMNTYTGGTTVNSGTLAISSDNNLGATAGGLTLNGGTLQVNGTVTNSRAISLGVSGGTIDTAASNNSFAVGGVISGSGALTKTGDGTLYLNGANTYSGGTTVSFGALYGTTTSLQGNITNNSSVRFDQNSDGVFAGQFFGTGFLTKEGTGKLTLSNDSSSFAGNTVVSVGTLELDGSLGGDVLVDAGATLRGEGNIAGAVNVASSGILANVSGATLSMGSLSLDSGSYIDVSLGAPAQTALFDIAGALILDGTLNVSDAGGFGAGAYRLFSYGGTLNNIGLFVGTVPVGIVQSDLTIQTSIAGQVNLLNSAGVSVQYWNGSATSPTGSIVGGTGTWTATGTNWTDSTATFPGPASPQPVFAIFSGATGMVTADDSQGAIEVSGMQFLTSGYAIIGDSITLAEPSNIIRVGDGTSSGASTEATIASVLTGTGALNKADFGSLTLTGANNYTGGTTISGGMLQIGDGSLSGSISGDVTNNAILAMNRSDDVSFSGTISGTGSVEQKGAGTTTLTGINTYAGGTTVSHGKLAGAANAFGSGSILVDSALEIRQATDGVLSNDIAGSGSVTKSGAGILVLTGASNHSGGTTISAGTLQIGNGGMSGSNAGNITNNAVLAFNRSDEATFAGAISGTGSVEQWGTGTTILSGANTYSGDTNVSSGTLQIDGSIAGNAYVLAGATLRGNGIIAGTANIGSGGVLANNSGATLKTGDLYLDASSVINAALGTSSNALFDVTGTLSLDGTLNVSDAGGFGAGIYRLFDYDGALVNNGLTVGGVPVGMNTSDIAIQTSIAGQVNLLNSAGVNIQYWNGSATSPTGTITGGNGNWSTTGTNWTDATATFNGPASPQPVFAVFAGNAGAVVVDGGQGAIEVSGMQFLTSGYNLEGDAISLVKANNVIRVGDGTSNSTSTEATIASALRGSGALEKSDFGTLKLTGTNDYSGGTTISAGVLQIGNGGTSGSIIGDVTNKATLAFNRADNFAFAGAISGSGSVEQRGTGTTTLTGINTYSGGTNVASGKLVGAANAFGFGAIANNGELEFNQGSNGVFGGSISGTGSVTKSGTGRLTLNGFNTYTGSTFIKEGELIIGDAQHPTASIASEVIIADGATLGGIGHIGGLTIKDGSTVHPGNSIGTLNVNGDITFEVGSNYEVEVDPSTTVSDLISVTGIATVKGGSVLHTGYAGSYQPLVTYTILSAQGGVVGTFDSVISNYAFVSPTLSYDTNNVYLTLLRNDTGFASVAETLNQKATAVALESLSTTNPLAEAISTLSADEARAAFDQLSGDIHASISGQLLDDSRFARNAALARLGSAFCEAGTTAGCSPAPQTYVAWGSIYGFWGDHSSNGNAASSSRSIGGFATGFDVPVEDWRVGLMAAYAYSKFKFDDRAAEANADSYTLGVYGGRQWGQWSAKAGAGYTWSNVSTDRVVAIANSGKQSADYNAGTAQVFGEVGYRAELGGVAIDPYANLAYINQRTSGFTEEGGIAALSSGKTNQDLVVSTLGLNGSKSFNLGDKTATISAGAGWRHAFGNVDPTRTMAFSESDEFAVRGLPVARDAAVINAGFDFEISPNATLGLSYDAQLAKRVTDQSVQLRFEMKF